MSAEFIDKTDPPVGISEGEKALSQHLDANLRPIGFRDF
jgi:hypothetical protein